ncbi:family 20 glycosyl hydrolase [Coniochaeta sp. 2T2.1]|nr:family 20 glycosyl hydrolase [Coniochaeta sp. 2T2.1]
MLSLKSCSLLLLSAVLTPVSALWPAPQSYSKGNATLYLHQNLQITYNGAFVCWTPTPDTPCPHDEEGTEYVMDQQLPYTYGFVPYNPFDARQLVQGGVSRALGHIFSDNFVPWQFHKNGDLSDFEPELHKGQTWVKSLQIVQTGKDNFKPLDGEVDESYNFTLSEDGSAKLTAVTSTGVLRGLETFSQLFYKHSEGPFWYTPYVPVSIQDAPRYPHRGILLDVARNWYDVKDILRTIDAMSWAKLNVIHIHITDSQSWPLEIPSIPELAKKGAYRPDLTYSPADIKMIQEYAIHRGVKPIIEIDMPGHIGSVAKSHPELITAYDAFPYHWWCAEPPCGAFKLNDTAVDNFLGKMFDDLLPRLAPYTSYFHTGGDELNANDSMLDPGVMSNSTEVLQPLLQKFIDNQHARVRKAGLTPMVWEEIPIDWNVTLGKDVVVQTWLGAASVKEMTSRGHQIIDSDYTYWYLDCGRGAWLNFDNGQAFNNFYPFNDWCGPTKSWAFVYQHDPAANLTAEEAKLVLGGEVAVWSETIDPVNMDSVIWPRAAAAGEVLWSGRQDATGQNRSQIEAAPRLSELRSLMVARGVSASPITMIWCTQAGNGTECSYPMGPGY